MFLTAFSELPLATAIATATTATSTTTTPTAAGPCTPTTPTAASTLPERASFVYDQGTAEKVLAVQRGDGFIGLFIIGDFHEAEAARLSGETITNHGDAIGLHTRLSEPCLQLLFGCLER